MKKAIVLMLALVMTMALAVPAAAAGTASPKAPTASETVTTPVPVVEETETKDENGAVVVVTPVEATDATLAQEEKQEMASAQTALEAAAPAGMKAQYFFFVKLEVKDDASKEAAPVAMTIKVENAADAVVMQFVDGKWVELEVVVNADGTITIKGVVNAPMAILTK